jgi:glutamate-1-semialdehyde 2,1-aminomutase
MSKEKPVPVASTFSKDPRAWGLPANTPAWAGKGGEAKLTNGRTCIDWVCGLGTNLLGYDCEEIVNEVVWQANRGASFSLPHYLEYTVAEKLVEMLGDHVPGWEGVDLQVRYGKTGTDACAGAVRLARAVTGCDTVISVGYHGWQDCTICTQPPAWGIPMAVRELTVPAKFGCLADLYSIAEDRKNKIACVIVEQGIEEPNGYYTGLRQFCDDCGALLVMDEVVTGLRYALGGTCEVYGIHPDIVCMGKALGNGMPISAIVAPDEYMGWFGREDPVFMSSTTFGDALSLAAANVVLDMWTEESVSQIWEIGLQLMKGLNEAGWKTVGHAPRSVLMFEDDLEKGYFIQEMFKRGVMMNRPNFPCLAHTEKQVQRTILEACHVRSTYLGNKMAGKLEELVTIPHVLFRGR